MYAVIEDSGTQIKVAAGDVIIIDPRDLGDGSSITFDRVLLIGGEKTSVGSPYVKGASVAAEVVEQFRDRKIDVIKFKRRKGYRRKQGHRQPYLRVRIGEISI